MSRHVLVQAQREDELRASFQQAAAQQYCSAAQVLRRLMQAYVTVQAAPGAAARALRHAPEMIAAVAVARQQSSTPDAGGDDRDLEQWVSRQYGWGTHAPGPE